MQKFINIAGKIIDTDKVKMFEKFLDIQIWVFWEVLPHQVYTKLEFKTEEERDRGYEQILHHIEKTEYKDS